MSHVFHDLYRMTRVPDNPDSLIHEQWVAAVRHKKRCRRPYWISNGVKHIPRMTTHQLRAQFKRLKHDFKCNYKPNKHMRTIDVVSTSTAKKCHTYSTIWTE